MLPLTAIPRGNPILHLFKGETATASDRRQPSSVDAEGLLKDLLGFDAVHQGLNRLVHARTTELVQLEPLVSLRLQVNRSVGHGKT